MFKTSAENSNILIENHQHLSIQIRDPSHHLAPVNGLDDVIPPWLKRGQMSCDDEVPQLDPASVLVFKAAFAFLSCFCITIL